MTKIANVILGEKSTSVKRLVLVVGSITALIYANRAVRRTHKQTDTPKSVVAPKKETISVNSRFFKKLYKLLKISIPSLVSKESGIVLALTLSMILRTWLSIQIAEVNGSIVKAIVNISFEKFLKKTLKLLAFAIPASIINSALEYFGKKIAIMCRENVVNNYHEKYLRNICFYQITNLDNRIENPDQIFTNDIDKWAHSLSNLYMNFFKPTMDIFLFSYKLSSKLGIEGPLIMIGWYFIAGVILKLTSPGYGALVAREQILEGEFRARHAGLLNHSEEIAFYRGNEWEKKKVDKAFQV